MDFGPSAYDCPRATLFKLTQFASVNEYYMQFTALANRVDGLSVKAILDYFISGLQDDISRDIKAMEPRTLTKVVALAKLFEEKYSPNVTFKANAYVPISSSNYPVKSFPTNQKPDNSTKPSLPPLFPTPNTKPFAIKKQNIKKISLAEIQLRREKKPLLLL